MATKVSVPRHEDVTDDATGQICTLYTIVVQRTAPDGKVTEWQLRKRFSAFAALYNIIKDRHAMHLESYVFPHKSMFNTFSKFTKDRRKAGFDELLAALVKIDPIPLELEDFLEIDDHIGDGRGRPHFLMSSSTPPPGAVDMGGQGSSSNNSNNNSNSSTGRDINGNRNNSSTSRPDATAGGIAGSGGASAGTVSISGSSSSSGSGNARAPAGPAPHTPLNIAAQFNSTSASNTAGSGSGSGSTRGGGMNLQLTEVHRSFLTMFVCIGTIYAAAVLVGIIDISSTSVVRMVVTVLSLVSTATYLRWLSTNRQTEVSNISSLSELINNIASTTTTPVRSAQKMSGTPRSSTS